jgi:hypothetical protein
MSAIHMLPFSFVDKFSSFEAAEHRLERTARLARLTSGQIEGFQIEEFVDALENLGSQADGSYLEDDVFEAGVPMWIFSLYSSSTLPEESASDSEDSEGDFYSDDPAPTRISREEMQKMICQMKQDGKSLMQCPIQISHNTENNNTTLLVNHTFVGKKNQSTIKVHSFVIKKTNMSEVAASFIYNAWFDSKQDGIRAPSICALHCVDEESGIFINSQMYLAQDSTAAAKITALFSQTIDCLVEEAGSMDEEEEIDDDEEIDDVLPAEGTTLMFAEKIQGNTMDAYVHSGQYSLNTVEQKQAFFHSIGKVSMLDLMMGVVDRFLPLEYSEELDEFIVKKEGGMNLGNAMVVLDPQSGGFSHLVTIDNEILNVLNAPSEEDAQLSHSTAEARKSYLQQIQGYGRNQAVLSSILVDTLATLIEERAEGNSGFAQLQTDLQSDSAVGASKCIEEGLMAMFETIQTRIIPQWQERGRASLKNLLHEQCPSVMGPLEERIEEFKALA